MARKDDAETREQAWVGVLMGAIAGGVDVIGYLGLAHLFTAHMSGNSAVLGADAGQGQWRAVVQKAFPIPIFVLGTFLGSLWVDSALRRKAAAPLTGGYLLELILLGGALGWGLARPTPPLGSPASTGLTVLMVLAMGVQNATLRRVGNTGIRTTFISGMLCNFAEALAAYWFWLHDRTHGRGLRRWGWALRVSPRQETVQQMRLFGGIWLSYVAGGLSCAIARSHWHWGALGLPLAGIGVILIVNALHPLTGASSVQQEAKDRAS
jgi:uncharacterized membrane protein YoaK (UPF0700 family)